MEQSALKRNDTTDEQNNLHIHTINDPELAKQIISVKPTTHLPVRLAEDMIVCLIDQQIDGAVEGTFLLFQTLKTGIQSIDWRSPYQHGVVISKGKVLFSYCKKQYDCDCVIDLLDTHFRHQGLHLTPENISDENGKVIAIKLSKNRRRQRHRYH